MTIDELIQQVTAKLGTTKAAALKPVIDKYGPAIVTMSADEIWRWVETAVRGDQAAAYAAILAKMPTDALLTEWTNLGAQWQAANAANAQAVAFQRDALAAVLQAILSILMAVLGF